MFERAGAQFGCSRLEHALVPAWASAWSWGRAAAPGCTSPQQHGGIVYATGKSLTLDISAAKATSCPCYCAAGAGYLSRARKERQGVPEPGDSWPHLASGPSSPCYRGAAATWLDFKPSR